MLLITKALQDATQKLSNIQKTIRGLQKNYIPADEWHKGLADKYDALVKTLNDAAKASKDANKLRDDTKQAADQAWQNWRQARMYNLLPSTSIKEPGKTFSELDVMARRAQGAKNEIQRIKNNNPAEKSAKTAQEQIDKLNGWITDDNSTMSHLQNMVNRTNKRLADATARLNAAKEGSDEYIAAQTEVKKFNDLLSNNTKSCYQDLLDEATKTNNQYKQDLQTWEML